MWGKRPRGRSKQTWADTLHNEMKLTELHPDKVTNRDLWKQKKKVAQVKMT